MRLLQTNVNEDQAAFSPDGRWVAYRSISSGRFEVYVQPFVTTVSNSPSLGEGRWLVSKDGGGNPRWRADGKEIFFSPFENNAMMAVDVDGSGAAFQVGAPRQLFAGSFINGWDVTGDGKRFLISSQGLQNAKTPITVVLNWQADLKR